VEMFYLAGKPSLSVASLLACLPQAPLNVLTFIMTGKTFTMPSYTWACTNPPLGCRPSSLSRSPFVSCQISCATEILLEGHNLVPWATGFSYPCFPLH
jgi:hypothetical protein